MVCSVESSAKGKNYFFNATVSTHPYSPRHHQFSRKYLLFNKNQHRVHTGRAFPEVNGQSPFARRHLRFFKNQTARRVAHDEDSEIWAKEMADGSKAVGLFDRGLLFDEPREITVTWEQLGLSGRQRVRDLWRQQDLGVFGDAFTATVPPHGVVLIRIQPEDTGSR